jgi:DNA polymerase-3 subunit gamma/tau
LSQALYRKWRSQTFDELVGQEHVVRTLRNAIRAGRVGHAYLFTGPRGVGKTTVARLLAKAVNCEAPLEARPCDNCDPCRSIAEGRAVDVIEMDAASHTGVDDAREIIEAVQYRPTSLRSKVYVIDETHMLSTAAFNALLKTLEEPPAHVLFILATTEFHKVPATIVSRCQRFVFTRHSVQQIAAHLLEVAQAEHVELDQGAAEMIARSATGAMRDALSVLDQLMAGGDGVVTLEQVQMLLGAAESGEVVGLIKALVNADLQAALRVIEEVADNGADLRQFARDLVDRLRSLMLLAATGDASALDLPAETVADLQAIAASVDLGQIVAWLKVFSNLDYQLKNSPYGQLPLELAAVEILTAPAPTPSMAPVRSASVPQRRPPAPIERQTPAQVAPSRPAPVEAVPPTATRDAPTTPQVEFATAAKPIEATPDGSTPSKVIDGTPPTKVIEVEDNAAFLLEEVEALWEQFMEDLRSENRMVHALMQGVSPINVEGQTLILLGTNAFHPQRLQQPRERKVVERILAKALQRPVHIRVTLDKQEEMPDARKQIQHVRTDPLVRRAINIFDAEVTGIEMSETSSP